MRFNPSAAVMLTLTSVWSAATGAQALPTPRIYIQVQGEGGFWQDYAPPGTYSAGAGVASVFLSPGVSASSTGNAVADVTYAFSADGAPNVMVPVTISYLLSSSASGDFSVGHAEFSTLLYNADGTPESNWYTIVCSDTGPSTCSQYSGWAGLTSFSGIATGYVPSNTPVYISLSTQSGGLNGTTASGFADPLITVLDPNFTLQLPDGVGNSTGLPSAVPEAPTWLMMLLGFTAVGLAIRRDRKRPHTPQLVDRTSSEAKAYA